MKFKNNYNHTIYASYIGYITQAIVNNFAPLLFLTFSREFSLTLDKIALITTINFAVQLIVDLLSAKLVDKIGYRISIISAHIFSALGLISLSFLPYIINSLAGIIISVIIYAVGGGLIEVLISPIVEACPTKKKEAAMSLLHSFYCWGHAGVVILSTLFFSLLGTQNWKYLSIIWALVPIVNAFYFSAVPIYSVTGNEKAMPIKELFKMRIFFLFLMLMICAGATEQAMSQWSSAFAESGLGVSKTIGDLAGPLSFALLMGTSRALYGKFSDKLPLKNAMIFSCILCIIAYLTASFSRTPVVGLIACGICGFSVGIFWPGTFSLAASRLPSAGTAMFAFMALAGDVGCSLGPTVTGFVANAFDGNLKTGLMFATIFPIIILILSLFSKSSPLQVGKNK